VDNIDKLFEVYLSDIAIAYPTNEIDDSLADNAPLLQAYQTHTLKYSYKVIKTYSKTLKNSRRLINWEIQLK